jgi:hypothetical protein
MRLVVASPQAEPPPAEALEEVDAHEDMATAKAMEGYPRLDEQVFEDVASLYVDYSKMSKEQVARFARRKAGIALSPKLTREQMVNRVKEVTRGRGIVYA